MFEFNEGVFGRELTIGLGVIFVPVTFPGSDFGLEVLSLDNTSVEAL